MIERKSFAKALILSVWLYSLLLWFYIVLRIVFRNVIMTNPFIGSFPFFSFYSLGVFSFALSFVSLLIYLTMWGIGAHKDPV